MSEGAFFGTDEERDSATTHMHAMKNQIGGMLEAQTKARLVKEGLMAESSEEEKKPEPPKKAEVPHKLEKPGPDLHVVNEHPVYDHGLERDLLLHKL